jgi:transposase-like protein
MGKDLKPERNLAVRQMYESGYASGVTMAEIGRQFGISREQVRVLLARAARRGELSDGAVDKFTSRWDDKGEHFKAYIARRKSFLSSKD